MKWAYELLGVAEDADSASIKRAYARLLRTTRPDEDASAFQRLNTAYKLALARATQAASLAGQSPTHAATSAAPNSPQLVTTQPTAIEDSEPAVTKTSTSPLSAQAHPAAAPSPVNPAVLAERIIRQAAEEPKSGKLAQWLEQCPEFWSLRIKQVTGQQMFHRLLTRPQAMSSRNLDTLLRFFDLDHVLTGINPAVMQQLRHRQAIAWEVEHDHSSLASRFNIKRGNKADTLRVRSYLGMLQQPRSWLRSLLAALTYGKARVLGVMAAGLSNGQFDQLPSSINREHAAFWYRAAATKTMTKERFLVSGMRALVAAIIGACILTPLIINGQRNNGVGTGVSRSAYVLFPALLSGACLLWLGLCGAAWIDHWQGAPEKASARRPWLRRVFIPALIALAFLFNAVDAHILALTLGWGALLLAVRRFQRRSLPRQKKQRPRIGSLMGPFVFFGLMLSNALTHVPGSAQENVPFFYLLAGATIAVWSVDVWRFRASLRWRKAA